VHDGRKTKAMSRPVGSGNAVTYTEVHAAVLGTVVGLLAVYLRSVGYAGVAVGLAVVLIGIALGLTVRERYPAAQRTVRCEPWYALAAFVAGGVVALAATEVSFYHYR
jgi:hypothetical protein